MASLAVLLAKADSAARRAQLTLALSRSLLAAPVLTDAEKLRAVQRLLEDLDPGDGAGQQVSPVSSEHRS